MKLRLMQAFDEIPDMLNHGRRLRLEAHEFAIAAGIDRGGIGLQLLQLTPSARWRPNQQ